MSAAPPAGRPTAPPTAATPQEAAAVLRRCVLLTLACGVVELVGGLATGSLSLVADAGHMATDGSGLLLSFLAARSVDRARRGASAPAGAPAEAEAIEAWAALANALLLLALVAGVLHAAAERLAAPTEVLALPALGVALGGLAVNLVVLRWLLRARPSLGVRAALWHVAGDLLGSLAALASSAVLALGLWPAADAAFAMLIAALLLVGALQLGWRALRVLRARRPG